jgi:outer membrane autotransporter protein
MVDEKVTWAKGQSIAGGRQPQVRLAWVATLLGSTALVACPDTALADCVNTGGSNYECSGAETVTQGVSDTNPTITATPDFSVDTPDPIAFGVAGIGTIYFQGGDANLRGRDFGIDAYLGGDDGGVPGSLVLLTSGDLSGGLTGLRAVNNSSGPTAISTDGFVEGGDRGIQITNGADTSGLSLYTHGVTGGNIGINAQHYGGGVVTVSAQGQVTGTNWYGITASNNPMTFNADGSLNSVTSQAGNPPTDVIVRASGGVTGGLTGLLALNGGMGVLQVDTLGGAVTGETRDGIVAMNTRFVLTPTDMWVTTDAVSGARHGIVAMNYGSGSNNVAAYGAVVGGTGYGIAAANGVFSASSVVNDGYVLPLGAAGTDLTIEAIDVSGGTVGIGANNIGTGATSVTATGNVEAGDTGIYVFNAATATHLIVNAADVSGGLTGINARNWGTGATVISATGIVEGGIYGRNEASAIALVIDANEVNSTETGIEAWNDGTGNTSITATGVLTGGSQAGVLVNNGATAGDLSVAVTDVIGGRYGIGVANGSAGAAPGDTTVVATGTVSGEAYGILAINGDVSNAAIGMLVPEVSGGDDLLGGNDLRIEANNVSGGELGIATLNGGTGATSIYVADAVEGNLGGILAENGGSATDLTIIAGDVSGNIGIGGWNDGTGATSITATGTVLGGAAGIYAFNGDLTTDLTIYAVDVSGGEIGIAALNSGTGETAIHAVGSVDGPIGAFNEENATNLVIEAADVSQSITAGNFGTGATSITATGPVQGGIFAENYKQATDITISVAEVSIGIGTGNFGTGATSITATGPVHGGILARNGEQATDITINATDVSGGTVGIFGANEGTGATSITAIAVVEGSFAGIAAYNAATATDLTINAYDVSGDTYGIYAANMSAGATTIKTTGTVTGPSAIVASGNTIDLTNNGVIVGLISLDSATTTFTNNGVWNGAGGESLFTGGASTLVSNGMVLGGTNASLAEATTWSGLGQFTTHGTVMLADGDAGDVLTTTGNAEFAAGSALSVDVGGAGGTDRFVSAGTVVLDGTSLNVNSAGALSYGTRYTVLTADGGLTGTFDTITGLPGPTAFLAVEEGYDANTAWLETIKYRNFADAGATPNQIATGQGLDTIAPGSALFTAVANLPTDAEAQFAFDQLSGEIHASAQTALIEDSRFVRNAANDRIRAAFGDVGASVTPVLAYGPGDTPIAVSADHAGPVFWSHGFGSWGSTDSDGNAAGLDRSTGGLLIGADTLVGDWRLGLLAGYSRSSFDVDDRASSGSSNNYHLGLYGGTQWGNLAFRTGAAYTWHDIDTNRTAAFPGFADSLSADYSAGTFQAFGELGYGIELGATRFEPFANLAHVSLRTDSFTEQGGPAALSVDGGTTAVTFTTLGLRAEHTMALGTVNATLRGMIGWRHAFGDLTPESVNAFAGGDAFTIAGAPIAQDSAVIEAGLDFNLTPEATFGLSYTGQIASDAYDHGFRANLSVRF